MSLRVRSRKGGTLEQYRVCNQVLADLGALVHCTTPMVVVFTAALPDDWLGAHLGRTIELKTTLAGVTLYRVFLHEIGHFLGLDHARRGIMAAHQGATKHSLTLRSRQLWCTEVARCVIQKRARELAA